MNSRKRQGWNRKLFLAFLFLCLGTTFLGTVAEAMSEFGGEGWYAVKQVGALGLICCALVFLFDLIMKRYGVIGDNEPCKFDHEGDRIRIWPLNRTQCLVVRDSEDFQHQISNAAAVRPNHVKGLFFEAGALQPDVLRLISENLPAIGFVDFCML